MRVCWLTGRMQTHRRQNLNPARRHKPISWALWGQTIPCFRSCDQAGLWKWFIKHGTETPHGDANQFPGHFGGQRDPWTSSRAQAGFVESVQKCDTKTPHGNTNQFPRHCGVHRDPWARSRDQAGFVEVARRSGGTITPAWWHKPISCAPQVTAVWAAPRDQAGFVKNDSTRWRGNPACRPKPTSRAPWGAVECMGWTPRSGGVCVN